MQSASSRTGDFGANRMNNDSFVFISRQCLAVKTVDVKRSTPIIGYNGQIRKFSGAFGGDLSVSFFLSPSLWATAIVSVFIIQYIYWIRHTAAKVPIQFGLMTSLITSTKLFYVEPG